LPALLGVLRSATTASFLIAGLLVLGLVWPVALRGEALNPGCELRPGGVQGRSRNQVGHAGSIPIALHAKTLV